MTLQIPPQLVFETPGCRRRNACFKSTAASTTKRISRRHNPEFTMIEFTKRFSDYERTMQMAEDIIRNASRTVNGTANITCNGKEVDRKARSTSDHPRSHQKYNPHHRRAVERCRMAEKEIVKHGESLRRPRTSTASELALRRKGHDENKCRNPNFIIDYPVEVPHVGARFGYQTNPNHKVSNCPLTDANSKQRYSELNDPETKPNSCKAQVAQKDAWATTSDALRCKLHPRDGVRSTAINWRWVAVSASTRLVMLADRFANHPWRDSVPRRCAPE